MKNIRSFTDLSESSKYIKEPTKCPRCDGSGLVGGSSDESIVKDFMKDYKMSKNASEFMTGILSSEPEAFINSVKRFLIERGINSQETLDVFRSLNPTKEEIKKIINSSEEALAFVKEFIEENTRRSFGWKTEDIERMKELINVAPGIISSLKRML
jgi:hypothetical protein